MLGQVNPGLIGRAWGLLCYPAHCEPARMEEPSPARTGSVGCSALHGQPFHENIPGGETGGGEVT